MLKDCSWEVKKGERVGLVGVNGAGKTTQLQIVMGKLQPDSGEIIKAKKNMRIAYLAQEFDVNPTRTVRRGRRPLFSRSCVVWGVSGGPGGGPGGASTSCSATHTCAIRRPSPPPSASRPSTPTNRQTTPDQHHQITPDTHTPRQVREEFYSVYNKQLDVMRRQEALSAELETVGARAALAPPWPLLPSSSPPFSPRRRHTPRPPPILPLNP